MKVLDTFITFDILLSMNNFLSTSSRNELICRHRKEQTRRIADRIKAVLLSDEGWTYRKISSVLLLDEQTVSRHVEEYVLQQKLTIDSGGSTGKLDESQTSELIAHLETTTYFKVMYICHYVEKQYTVSYSPSGMTFWLHHNGFSYKQPKKTPAKADPAKQEEFIDKYNDLLNCTPEDEPILFGDGIHPTMATKVTSGWIRTGVDKPIATTASRTRINLMGAINLETMKVTLDQYETLDSHSIVEYLDLLKRQYLKSPKIHLILDRGPYNTSAITKVAAKNRDIVLHYLPTYSPNLNPIERLWKIMNEHVRNNVVFKSAKKFRQKIMLFFKVTWPKIASSMVDRINDNFQCIKSTV